MGWWSSARTAAAHEFGRRHYRGIAAFEVGRKAAPAVAVLAILGVGVALVWRWHGPAAVHIGHGWSWATAHLLALLPVIVVIALAVVVAVAWRRWGAIIAGLLEVALPVEHPVAWAFVVLTAVLVVGGGVAAAFWLT